MRYSNDTRIPVEPPRDVLMKLGYQYSNHVILLISRVPQEIPRDTVITLSYQCSHQDIL